MVPCWSPGIPGIIPTKGGVHGQRFPNQRHQDLSSHRRLDGGNRYVEARGVLMRVSAVAVSAAILAAITIFSAGGLSLSRPAAGHPAPSGSPPAGLTVDYPLEGSVFPPEITSPTFLFR